MWKSLDKCVGLRSKCGRRNGDEKAKTLPRGLRPFALLWFWKNRGQTERSASSRQEPRGNVPSVPNFSRADMYRRLGRTAEARSSYEKALALTQQEPERQFLQERIRQLK